MVEPNEILLALHGSYQFLKFSALGDWTADTGGLGFAGAAGIFVALLAILAGGYFWNKANRVFLFWAAFIMTRPLGAAVGDFLDKRVDHGGLAFSRPLASAVLAIAIVSLVFLLPQRAGTHSGKVINKQT